ncbi:MAG: lipase family alpha/beta hydrolase, partial [Marinicellaceae bacterium]
MIDEKIKIYMILVLIFINLCINSTIAKNSSGETERVNQKITMMFITPPSGPNAEFVIDVDYNTDNSNDLKTSGVGIRIHWSSNELGLTTTSNIFSDKLFSSGEVQLDVHDYDNDYQTDVYQQFIWFDENSSWPTSISSTTLLTATFKTSPYFSGAKINISQIANHPVTEDSGNNYAWGFKADSMKIIIAQDAIFANPFETSINPAFQNVFTGDSMMCSTDIDGDGIINPFSDGVILKRYLAGVTDTALLENTLSESSTRTISSQIINYLLTSNCQKMLDIDINQAIEQGYDDELFVRYLFEMGGTQLTDSTIGIGAEQTDAEDIFSWLQLYSQEREVQLDTNIQMGVQTFTSDGVIGITPTNNNLNTQVILSLDEEGDTAYQINATEGVEVDIEMVLSESVTVNSANRSLFPCKDKEYKVGNCTWQIHKGLFADSIQNFDINRLPKSKESNGVINFIIDSTIWFDLTEKTSSILTSSCDSSDSNNSCLDHKPVLFIHGFVPLGLGGGVGTWGQFPKLVEQLVVDEPGYSGYTAFEFKWRTYAKFEDVASELAEAIELIQLKTGKKPHIVAHSFGGILIRTYLQYLAYGSPHVSHSVDKVITVGTPHSGIADTDTCFDNKIFPKGQDNNIIDFFELCTQISCHQAGEPTIFLFKDLFDVEDSGTFMTKLACPSKALPGCSVDYPLADIDMLVILGVTKDNGFAGTGDGLIAYEGQRFMPTYTKTGSCGAIIDSPSDLGQNITFLSGAKIQEKMIDTSELGVKPGDTVTFPYNNERGFKHTGDFLNKYLWDWPGTSHEVWIDCSSAETCQHPTFIATRNFFESDLNVSINQAFGQPDPTFIDSADYTISFSKSIEPSTFTENDLNVSNPLAIKTLIPSSANYTEWLLKLNN